MRRKQKIYLREFSLLLVLLGLVLSFMIPKFLAMQNINDKEHFPDPEFRKDAETFMNVKEGGRFSEYEAAHRKGSFKLTSRYTQGLHYFKSITDFHCGGLNSTHLNLSSFEELVIIEIRNVLLDELVLPKSGKLQNLSIEFTNLDHLDLSGQKGLNFLNCSNNLISHLDLSPVSDLNRLTCENNQLTEIDLSPVPHLTGLSCKGNKLTQLDLSVVPQLGTLQCGSNRISHINWGDLRDIKVIYCSNNELEDIAAFLSFPWLNGLHIENNRLDRDDWDNVMKIKKQMEKLSADSEGLFINCSYSPQKGIDPYDFSEGQP